MYSEYRYCNFVVADSQLQGYLWHLQYISPSIYIHLTDTSNGPPCDYSVQIDDFLQNYIGTRPYTPPKPVNETDCTKCPASAPHVYGGGGSGAYCCAVKPGSSCPAGNGECCLSSGTVEGCQGIKHCEHLQQSPRVAVSKPDFILEIIMYF